MKNGLIYVKDPTKLFISKDGTIYEHLGTSTGKSYGFPDKLYDCEIINDVMTNKISHVLVGDFQHNFSPYLSESLFGDKTEEEIFNIAVERLEKYLGASLDDINKNNHVYMQGVNVLVDSYLSMYYSTKSPDPRLRKELTNMVTHLFLSMKIMEKKKADEKNNTSTPSGDSK